MSTPKRGSFTVARAARRLLERNDRGIALPMVLLVFIVGVALITAFLVAIAGSARVTASSKQVVQAQAAAEAGIDTVIARASSGDPCAGTGTIDGSDPGFHAVFSCNGAGDELTITSTSTEPAGVARTVQTVVSLRSAERPPTAGGPGLFYTYGMNSRLNGYVFDAEHSEVGIDQFAGSAGVYASTGNIACGTGSVFPSDIYTATGNLQLDSGCLVEGNAYIGGTANVNGGTIEGDLIAPKNVGHTISGVVGKAGAGVGGNVQVGGYVTVNGGTVYGNVTAAGTAKSTLGSNEIKGNFTYKGTAPGNWGSNIVKGVTSQNTALTAPVLPPIPGWQDVSFVPVNATTPPQAWQDEGYRLVTATTADCSKWSGNSTDVTALASSLSYKTIFDIRVCTGGFDTNAGGANKIVSVNKDIAIIARKWFLSGTQFKSADGANHTVFLITPDSQPATAGPQCSSPGAQDSEQLNNSKVDPKLAVYIYTPCQMKFNGGSFRGQVYAGKIDFGGGVNVAFAPRNIPGYDFGAGYDPVGGGGDGEGADESRVQKVLSQRNVDCDVLAAGLCP